ncbi:MAG: hypothetical protein ACRC33_13980 [Gemmataceae bacterium]
MTAIHQHDAPSADLTAERLSAAQKLGKSTLDLVWHEKAVGRVAAALAASSKRARPVTHVGTGEAKVDRVASNRRVFGKGGKVELFRGSAIKNPRARAAPEGQIDPWLKTLSFWDRDRALASVSVYATHPMSFYGQGNVSSDFPGLARRRRQADDPGVIHFYANGCGGDLAAGKHNDGSPEARALGYGDYGPVYIPSGRAFAEGGYEPGAWSFVGVGVERQLKGGDPERSGHARAEVDPGPEPMAHAARRPDFPRPPPRPGRLGAGNGLGLPVRDSRPQGVLWCSRQNRRFVRPARSRSRAIACWSLWVRAASVRCGSVRHPAGCSRRSSSSAPGRTPPAPPPRSWPRCRR